MVGKPYSIPDPPPLPVARVQVGPPFSITGLDFTVALYIKRKAAAGECKVYICLFACSSTRAVHLEIVTDLTEVTFLQAFRTFAVRRSLPRLVLSVECL